jgi:hypothetical protein
MDEHKFPINVLGMAKDGEHYLFLFEDDRLPDLLTIIDEYADDPELSLTYEDAALLKRRVAELRIEPA